MDTSPHKSDFVKVNDVRLNYLDWGGNGPVLLFLTGLGCSAHIFDRFAPRFTDKFRVLGLTRRGHGDSDYPETGYDPDTLTNDVRAFMDALHIDRAILAGHSLANVELCHFSALYPERVLKLVFLDAAFDRTSPAFTTKREKNPLRAIPIPGLDEAHYTVENYLAAARRAYPWLAGIWGDVVETDIQHAVKTDPDGKIVDKMSEAIGSALNATARSYKPEDTLLKAPVLSFFAIPDANDYLAPEYMTEEQQAAVIDYFTTVRPPLEREQIEQFQRDVPHARIVEIPKGHHYCFIKQEELVFNAMREFLLEA